ncbi:hypothetical protein Cch01nite_13220 [Cellulomonas chitinilytica]|uniref:DUF402 domain-containing protein n=1 Tax=Cellulomonas chitinilytica TaxID=398759 RepID=A0A919NZM4_9CELL|nr:DUF402 domain-containing protein [Cellulomonas chitinilytica]GIG20598.1 hypothetical protein Cch01nite_13220 [Cellulomonas chitinilytica]
MVADLTGLTGLPDASARRPWEPGTVVALRHVLAGRTWCHLPVTVLRDDPDVTAVRISAGSSWLAAVGPDGRRVHTWADDWSLAPAVWSGDDCTYVLRPGRWCATGWFAPADGSGPGRYYVNAQRPFVVVPEGVETLDLELDVELHPPAFVPAWKDADRFDRAVRAGVLTGAEAELVVQHTREAVADLPHGPDGALLAELRAVVVPPARLDEVDAAVGVTAADAAAHGTVTGGRR